MSDYYEFYVNVNCPECEYGQLEAVEFEIMNRTNSISSEEKSVQCESCDHLFKIKPRLCIEVDYEVV